MGFLVEMLKKAEAYTSNSGQMLSADGPRGSGSRTPIPGTPYYNMPQYAVPRIMESTPKFIPGAGGGLSMVGSAAARAAPAAGGFLRSLVSSTPQSILGAEARSAGPVADTALSAVGVGRRWMQQRTNQQSPMTKPTVSAPPAGQAVPNPPRIPKQFANTPRANPADLKKIENPNPAGRWEAKDFTKELGKPEIPWPVRTARIGQGLSTAAMVTDIPRTVDSVKRDVAAIPGAVKDTASKLPNAFTNTVRRLPLAPFTRTFR